MYANNNEHSYSNSNHPNDRRLNVYTFKRLDEACSNEAGLIEACLNREREQSRRTDRNCGFAKINSERIEAYECATFMVFYWRVAFGENLCCAGFVYLVNFDHLTWLQFDLRAKLRSRRPPVEQMNGK